MSKIKRLPDAELEIMNALWDADAPLTAAELETALPGPPRARTTLLTLLARLEEKGCVTREKQGEGLPLHRRPDPGRVSDRRKPQSVGPPFRRQPRNFVAALAETDTLTDADIDELAEYLEELKKRENSVKFVGTGIARPQMFRPSHGSRVDDEHRPLRCRGGFYIRPGALLAAPGLRAGIVRPYLQFSLDL